MKRVYRRLVVLPLVILTAQVFAPAAGASHSWVDFHWARTSNPFALQLGGNLSGNWPAVLNTSSLDWSKSTVLDTTVVPGRSSPKRCNPTAGRVEICNAVYGRNGWLGVASVWATGSHVTQATVKLNDSYFNTSRYNTPAWRNSVMCQEVGHTLGLGHNDEDFATTNGTCMDYANDPTSNQHPDDHDYKQLEAIYSHADSNSTVISSAGSSNNASADLYRQDGWGRAIRFTSDGRPVVFQRDLGRGERLFTFVVWAE